MAEISRSIDIDAPIDVVFDYVTNPNNTVKYSPQFTKFIPVSQLVQGLGAKVEAAGNYMGMTIKTILEVTEFERNKKFVSRSTHGVKSVSTWEFSVVGTGKTKVKFTSDYSLPGRALGWLLDKMLIEKDVEKTTVETLVNLKRILENKPNLRPAEPAHW
ncbi:SRPBCC family protein [Candidatus Chlorohelix sp.]|uniref:SRPBCC family protein n=1 Tax=Candidatus Chlorohelix sp. TaxID=3139201 RepID=UPI0030655F41